MGVTSGDGEDIAEEDDDDDDVVAACVCPEDLDKLDDSQLGEEQEEGGGDGGDGGGSSSTSGADATAEEMQDFVEQDTKKNRGRKDKEERKTGKKKGNKKSTATSTISKPFAGIGRKKGTCDCCGGRTPRGPGGSIVLTSAAEAEAEAASQDTGDGNDDTPFPSTPSGGGSVARAQQQRRRPVTFVETECRYHSVRTLIGDFKAQAHKGLTQLLKKYTFVGMVDLHLSLLQFNTKLVLVNHTELSKEVFFQMTLRRFGVMPRLALAEPLPVETLIRAALDLPEAGWAEADGDKDELAQDASKLLEEKSPMLEEYFMMTLSRRGKEEKSDGGGGANGREGKEKEKEQVRNDGDEALCISSLPLLLEGHSPVPEGLPLFLLRLTTEVDWSEERTCFEGVAAELALFYSTLPQGGEEDTPPPRTPSKPSGTPGSRSPPSAGVFPQRVEGPAAGAGAGAAGADRLEFGLAPAEATAVVQHILYPAFRWALMPPKTFATDGTVMQLACLERLYKVFERC